MILSAKVFCSMMIGNLSDHYCVGIHIQTNYNQETVMDAEGKINKCKSLCTWRMISVRLVIHNTYVILCNELFEKFKSGITVLTSPEDIVTIEVT